MSSKRSYGDQCGIARALELVGERWALLVVRELIYGPKRFTDLRRGLPSLGPDVLSQRLRDLEQAGLLRKRTLEPPAAAQVYELTNRGQALEPVLLELGRWGSEAPFPTDGAAFSADSFVLALRTVFSSERAAKVSGDYELVIGADRFRATVANGAIEFERGGADRAETTIEGEVATLAELLPGTFGSTAPSARPSSSWASFRRPRRSRRSTRSASETRGCGSPAGPQGRR
jgi:DNA-binding HxlR family transcriptional regulator